MTIPSLAESAWNSMATSVGQQNDPQQQIAELRPALDVGGEVAGVHVGDRGDHGRAGERQEAAQAPSPAGQRLAAGSDRAIRQAQALAHAAETIL